MHNSVWRKGWELIVQEHSFVHLCREIIARIIRKVERRMIKKIWWRWSLSSRDIARRLAPVVTMVRLWVWMRVASTIWPRSYKFSTKSAHKLLLFFHILILNLCHLFEVFAVENSTWVMTPRFSNCFSSSILDLVIVCDLIEGENLIFASDTSVSIDVNVVAILVRLPKVELAVLHFLGFCRLFKLKLTKSHVVCSCLWFGCAFKSQIFKLALILTLNLLNLNQALVCT